MHERRFRRPTGAFATPVGLCRDHRLSQYISKVRGIKQEVKDDGLSLDTMDPGDDRQRALQQLESYARGRYRPAGGDGSLTLPAQEPFSCEHTDEDEANSSGSSCMLFQMFSSLRSSRSRGERASSSRTKRTSNDTTSAPPSSNTSAEECMIEVNTLKERVCALERQMGQALPQGTNTMCSQTAWTLCDDP